MLTEPAHNAGETFREVFGDQRGNVSFRAPSVLVEETKHGQLGQRLWNTLPPLHSETNNKRDDENLTLTLNITGSSQSELAVIFNNKNENRLLQTGEVHRVSLLTCIFHINIISLYITGLKKKTILCKNHSKSCLFIWPEENSWYPELAFLPRFFPISVT